MQHSYPWWIVPAWYTLQIVGCYVVLWAFIKCVKEAKDGQKK